MRTIRIVGLSLGILILSLCDASAHKEWVHQYMVKQAYLLLKAQMGGEIQQMSQFVGMSVMLPRSQDSLV